MGDPAYAHLPEALEAGAVERGGARRRACGGCSRRSSGWACSTSRTSTRTGPARCSPTPRTARWPASPPSGRPCCCATRATLLPLDAGSARLDRGDRPAGRLPARHPRALGLRLRPGRDRHRPRGHPAPGRRRSSRSSTRRASGRRSAPSRRCSTCSAATRPADPAGLRRRRRARSGRSSWPASADVAVVVVGEWQNMIGEAASRSSPRAARPAARAAAGRRRRPARRWCCW